MSQNHSFRSRGFTLIEMIAVIAIIAIITAFVVPSVSSLFRATQLTQASTIVTDQISLARQEAVTKNSMIEVRLIRFADPETPGETLDDPTTGQFRAIQLLQVLPSGVAVPAGNVVVLPSGTVMNCGASSGGSAKANPSLSSLLPTGSATVSDYSQPVHGTPQTTDPDLPRNVKKNYDFYAFRFLSDGSTTLQPVGNWYVTVNLINDLPKLTSFSDLQNVNFFTLQLDASSGSTRAYRPTAG